MNNISARPFIRLLTHPLALGGMALLALNDLVFQRLTPGWLTGKLGDFAWFLFAPYLLAALLALALPARLRTERIAGALAFGLSLAGFATLKTIPVAHQAALQAAASAGLGLKLALDPGDLAAALAGSLFSLLVWLRAHPAPLRTGRASLAVMAAASVLIAADAAMPNPGINCLIVDDMVLKAGDAASVYVSSDGGLTWSESSLWLGGMCNQGESDAPPRTVAGRDDLRYTPGIAVERSSDGGQTWQVVYQLIPLAEVDREYYRIRNQTANSYVSAAPLDALADPQTGNILFAMGHEGVLVNTAEGEWRWVSVGPYAFERGVTFERLFTLLAFHLLVGLLLAGLAFTSLSLPLRSVWWKWLLLVLAGLIWLGLAFSPPASFQTNYALSGLFMVPCAVLTGLALVLALAEVLRRSPQLIVKMALWSLGSGLAYILGPIFWALGVLPTFGLAALIGLALAAGIFAWAVTRVRRIIRKTEELHNEDQPA